MTQVLEPRADIRQKLLVTDEILDRGIREAAKDMFGPDAVVATDMVEIRSLLGKPGVASGSAGVWQIDFQTVSGQSGSFILKGIWNEKGRHDDLWGTTNKAPSDPFDWGREARAYASRILDGEGVGGVRAAHFYGLVQSPEGVQRRRVGIAIEKAKGLNGQQMTIEDFAIAARRLGAMQGIFLVRALSDKPLNKPWLAVGYTREYVNRVEKMRTDPDNAQAWANPVLAPFLTRKHNGMSLRDATTQAWDQRDMFLDLLESIPTTSLAHNDLWQGQLYLDEKKTLLLDLAALGIGPLGQDLGKLVTEIIARDMLPRSQFERIENAMFHSYLSGLAEAGIDVGKPAVQKLVQLGWVAGVAAGETYRLGADWVPLAIPRADDEERREDVVKDQWGGRTMRQVFAFYADRSERLLQHVDKAIELANDKEIRPYLGKPLQLEDVVAKWAMEEVALLVPAVRDLTQS